MVVNDSKDQNLNRCATRSRRERPVTYVILNINLRNKKKYKKNIILVVNFAMLLGASIDDKLT